MSATADGANAVAAFAAFGGIVKPISYACPSLAMHTYTHTRRAEEIRLHLQPSERLKEWTASEQAKQRQRKKRELAMLHMRKE